MMGNLPESMDAIHGPWHILSVVNICRFWEENLKQHANMETQFQTYKCFLSRLLKNAGCGLKLIIRVWTSEER